MYLLVVQVFLLSSCSPKIGDTINTEDLVVFPAPPDTTRIQFLTRVSNSADIAGEKSGFMNYVIGKEEEVKPLGKPYGLAVAPGKIYICDTQLGNLSVINLATRSFEYFQPKGLGALRKPINAFVDQEGFLYVADVDRRQVVVFDQNQKYVAGVGDASVIKPTDVFVYENKIWVTDIANNVIRVYSRESFELLFSFPEVEHESPGNLFSPTNLFVIDDKVYVSDFGDFRIKVYTAEGEFLRSIGSYGAGVGQFVRPKGIAVDKDLNLFVVDAGFENVQIFNDNDQLLMFFGGSYEGPGYLWLPAKVVIDYDNLAYFEQYVDERSTLLYLLYVTNQFGPDKISIYGFVKPKS